MEIRGITLPFLGGPENYIGQIGIFGNHWDEEPGMTEAGNDATTVAMPPVTLAEVTEGRVDFDWTLPSIFLLLFSIGVVANVGSLVTTVLSYKSLDNYHCFLHIPVANILVLFPVPFLVIARFQESWIFGDISAKVLSLVGATAHIACALHLASLCVSTCKRLFTGKQQQRTKGWEIVLGFLIWLIALMCSWPVVLYPGVLQDRIKGSQGGSLTAQEISYIKIKMLLTFALPCILVILSFLFIYMEEKRRKKQAKYDKNFSPSENECQVKETVIIPSLFFALWTPFYTCRLLNISTVVSPKGQLAYDITLACGLLFTCLMPLFRHIFCKKIRQIEGKLHRNPSPDSKDETTSDALYTRGNQNKLINVGV